MVSNTGHIRKTFHGTYLQYPLQNEKEADL